MSREPIYMSDKRYDEISEMVYKSYNNACILFIDEVKNDDLYASYAAYKSELTEKRGDAVEEKLVFHGTSANVIDVICRDGFDPTKNISSSFGKGSYFAKDASYSKQYMKSTDSHEVSYMFLAKLAVGKCILHTDTDKDFDNYVNNLTMPTIFVTPHRYGAFPQYIVGFYKNAV
jgi:poly [ADP-ribose] polymerase 7/11/12/13